MDTQLADDVRDAVNRRLRAWRDAGFAERLWRKDPTLWADPDTPQITDRLGWLDLPDSAVAQLDAWDDFAQAVRTEGFQDVVLCGMGGSSLAPEVFQRTFGNAMGCPELRVLDSTHPDAVRGIERAIDLDQTLVLVSSKSGTTTETLSFFRYFWQRMSERSDAPGRRFAAITDAGTPLEALADERGFRAAFNARSDVGGRFSALTAFGLVPAALIGLDAATLLRRAQAMADACGPAVPSDENEALRLGATIGELARAGRDKLTFATSEALCAFPDWLEQLIAESLGKDGTGVVPVVGEPLGPPDAYADDRAFVHLRLAEERDAIQEEHLSNLEDAGHPVIRIELGDRLDLGREIVRWEIAIAAAGALLEIHPFNQPDVELAKRLAKEAMGRTAGGGAEQTDIEALDGTASERAAAAVWQWLDDANSGDYLGIQAYVAPTARANEALQEIRLHLRNRSRRAVTFGYGPRFLHSTGQLHKGGPNTGLFLQLVDEPSAILPVPETNDSFRQLIRAQADGDCHALVQQGRRVLRLNLGAGAGEALERLQDALR
mgnify:CR=1 FL=1